MLEKFAFGVEESFEGLMKDVGLIPEDVCKYIYEGVVELPMVSNVRFVNWKVVGVEEREM